MTQITVGIPVFNAMPYLPEALESILRQSFTDFTILAINDGSTDGSLEYLQSIRDPRLRILSQAKSGIDVDTEPDAFRSQNSLARAL